MILHFLNFVVHHHPTKTSFWLIALFSLLSSTKVCFEPSAHLVTAFPGFLSIKWQEMLLPPPSLDGMPVHHKVTPQLFIRPPWQFTSTHLYSWMEIGTVSVLPKILTTMTQPGLTLTEVRMAEWLGRWTCNLVVLDSSPPPYHSLDLSSVTPISTTQLCCVNKPTVLSPASWDFQALYVYLKYLFLPLFWPRI